MICIRENDVRGFLRFGGVLFWYGCPTLRPAPASTRRSTDLDYQFFITYSIGQLGLELGLGIWIF